MVIRDISTKIELEFVNKAVNAIRASAIKEQLNPSFNITRRYYKVPFPVLPSKSTSDNVRIWID